MRHLTVSGLPADDPVLLEDVLAEPDDVTMHQTIRSISWLVRTIRFDRIVPFDDVEVEAAAHLREHLRVPGMGDTRAVSVKIVVRSVDVAALRPLQFEIPSGSV